MAVYVERIRPEVHRFIICLILNQQDPPDSRSSCRHCLFQCLCIDHGPEYIYRTVDRTSVSDPVDQRAFPLQRLRVSLDPVHSQDIVRCHSLFTQGRILFQHGHDFILIFLLKQFGVVQHFTAELSSPDRSVNCRRPVQTAEEILILHIRLLYLLPGLQPLHQCSVICLKKGSFRFACPFFRSPDPSQLSFPGIFHSGTPAELGNCTDRIMDTHDIGSQIFPFCPDQPRLLQFIRLFQKLSHAARRADHFPVHGRMAHPVQISRTVGGAVSCPDQILCQTLHPYHLPLSFRGNFPYRYASY